MSRDQKHVDQTPTLSKVFLTHLTRYNRYALELEKAMTAKEPDHEKIEICKSRLAIEEAMLYHPFNQILFNEVIKIINENADIDPAHILTAPEATLKQILCEKSSNHTYWEHLNASSTHIEEWVRLFATKLQNEFIKFIICEAKILTIEFSGFQNKILDLQNKLLSLFEEVNANKENINVHTEKYTDLKQHFLTAQQLILNAEKIIQQFEKLANKIKNLLVRIDDILKTKNNFIQYPAFIDLLKERRSCLEKTYNGINNCCLSLKQTIFTAHSLSNKLAREIEKISTAPSKPKTRQFGQNLSSNEHNVFLGNRPVNRGLSIKLAPKQVNVDEKRLEPSA